MASCSHPEGTPILMVDKDVGARLLCVMEKSPELLEAIVPLKSLSEEYAPPEAKPVSSFKPKIVK